MWRHNNESGFSVLEGFFVIVVVGAIIAAGWYILNRNNVKPEKNFANNEKVINDAYEASKARLEQSKQQVETGSIKPFISPISDWTVRNECKAIETIFRDSLTGFSQKKGSAMFCDEMQMRYYIVSTDRGKFIDTLQLNVSSLGLDSKYPYQELKNNTATQPTITSPLSSRPIILINFDQEQVLGFPQLFENGYWSGEKTIWKKTLEDNLLKSGPQEPVNLSEKSFVLRIIIYDKYITLYSTGENQRGEY